MQELVRVSEVLAVLPEYDVVLLQGWVNLVQVFFCVFIIVDVG